MSLSVMINIKDVHFNLSIIPDNIKASKSQKY